MPNILTTCEKCTKQFQWDAARDDSPDCPECNNSDQNKMFHELIEDESNTLSEVEQNIGNREPVTLEITGAKTETPEKKKLSFSVSEKCPECNHIIDPSTKRCKHCETMENMPDKQSVITQKNLVKCPKCDGMKTEYTYKEKGGLSGAMIGGALFGIAGAMIGSALNTKNVKEYKCLKCGFKWHVQI